MTEKAERENQLKRIFGQFGSVVTAALAFLGQNNSIVNGREIFGAPGAVSSSTVFAADERTLRKAKPLVLHASGTRTAGILVGHRSHSSHSSHRSHSSHVSGGGGSSHYSSSAPLSRSSSDPESAPLPPASKSRRPPTSTPKEVEPEAPAKRDLSDPRQRFQVVGMLKVKEKPEAIILDWSNKKRIKVFEEDELDKYIVSEIDFDGRTVTLMDAAKHSFVLKSNIKPTTKAAKHHDK